MDNILNNKTMPVDANFWGPDGTLHDRHTYILLAFFGAKSGFVRCDCRLPWPPGYVVHMVDGRGLLVKLPHHLVGV